MERDEIRYLLLETPYGKLQADADAVRREILGDHVCVRGLIEFSNRCVCNCRYCGLRSSNTRLRRYRLPESEVLQAVDTATTAGVDTVVLQSGEDPGLPACTLARTIEKIRNRYPHLAVTLSVGERSKADYALWRRAGAERFLIKHEMANPHLYATLHPGRTLDQRLTALRTLAELGYTVGSGFIIGVPWQTVADLIDDILLIQHLQVGMCGAGPFIPQGDTPLHGERKGSVSLTLRVMAVLRLVLPQAHLPATTALASLDPVEGQCHGLVAGGDVLMPSFTPEMYRNEYRIYDHKKRVGVAEACAAIKAAGRTHTLHTETPHG